VQPAKKNWAGDVKSGGNGLPSRVILHGVEGVGKTSIMAFAPNPLFIMSRGETGLETLIDSGQLPDIPHLPQMTTWQDMLSAIDWLTTEEHAYKTLVIDVLSGLERLCHEFVCNRDYAGDWGERGFTGYMRGYEVSLPDWREMLAALDRLREKKRMGIVGLCHTKVAPFKNPEGADYDRFSPDMHHKTWAATHAWADMVLFLNHYVEVVTDKGNAKKGKGKGGQQRVLYTERTAAYDAKNRFGLPPEINLGDSGQAAWNDFSTAIKAARAQSQYSKKGGE
jgi:hypothetical protein